MAVASPVAADLSRLSMTMATPIDNDEEVALPSFKPAHHETILARSATEENSGPRMVNRRSKARKNLLFVLGSIILILTVFTAVRYSGSNDSVAHSSSSTIIADEPEEPPQSPAELAQQVWTDNVIGLHYWAPSSDSVSGAVDGQCINHPGWLLHSEESYTNMAQTMLQVFQDPRLTIAVEDNILINSNNETNYYTMDISECIRMQDFSETVLEESSLVPADVSGNLTRARLTWLERVATR